MKIFIDTAEGQWKSQNWTIFRESTRWFWFFLKFRWSQRNILIQRTIWWQMLHHILLQKKSRNANTNTVYGSEDICYKNHRTYGSGSSSDNTTPNRGSSFTRGDSRRRNTPSPSRQNTSKSPSAPLKTDSWSKPKRY